MGVYRQTSKSASGRKVQQREIAAAAGVSISTVSRVLNDVASVTISREVKERVLNVAAKLGYPLARDKPASLTLFLKSMAEDAAHDPFTADIMAGVEIECAKQGILLNHIAVDTHPEGISVAIRNLREHPEDGFLFLGIEYPELIEQAVALRSRVVLLNASLEKLVLDEILPDNPGGGAQAIQYLTQQGHRSILYITFLERITIQRRLAGYRAALAEAGIAYDPELVLNLASTDLAHVYQRMQEYLASPHPDFSAIFAFNDTTALGIMRALQEVGLRVPQDVSLLGFDDIDLAAFLQPPLTTIRVERKEIGKLGVRRLLDRMTEPGLVPARIELQCRVIERQSVAKR